MFKKIMFTSLLGLSVLSANTGLLPSLNTLQNNTEIKVDNSTEQVSHWKDLNTAIELSKQNNKLILVLLYSNTCPHCKTAIEFLNQKDIFTETSKNYNMVKLEGDTDFVPEMFLTVQSVPSFFIINSDKQLVVPALEGYTVDEIEWMNYLNQVSSQYQLYLEQNKY